MEKNKFIFVLLCILVLFLLLQKEPQEKTALKKEIINKNSLGEASKNTPQSKIKKSNLKTSNASPKGRMAKTNKSNRRPQSSSPHSILTLMPSVLDIREEIKKNPHRAASLSLVKLSREINEAVISSLPNPKKSKALLEDLSTCVTDKTLDTTSTVRTFCLSQAHRITKKYPSLESRFTTILSEAPERVLELYKSLGKTSGL